MPFYCSPALFLGLPRRAPPHVSQKHAFCSPLRDRGEWRIIPIAWSMRWRIELHIPCINSSGLVWLYNCRVYRDITRWMNRAASCRRPPAVPTPVGAERGAVLEKEGGRHSTLSGALPERRSGHQTHLFGLAKHHQIVEKLTVDLEDGGQPIRDPIQGRFQQMRLTPMEWGLRAPITPRLGGNPWALPRLGKSEPNKKSKPTLNTKLRILPLFQKSQIGDDHEPTPSPGSRQHKSCCRLFHRTAFILPAAS